MSVKSERIGNNLLKEISEILRFEARDEELKWVTVTYVKVTPDLGHAKIYYNVLNKGDLYVVQKALDGASGYIRTELAKRVDLRHMPELSFVYDESIDYGDKIEKILEDIK